MALVEDSHVRRERQRKAKTDEATASMRAQLPIYTLEQIREFKLPYYKALLINLNEKGLVCSAAFIEQLVDYQETARKKAGPLSSFWSHPLLINSRNKLRLLSEGLVRSEEYHYAENYAKQCEEFLKLAVDFAFSSADWWWLGEQLLIQSVSITAEYTFLGGKHEALSKFAYAKYLIENAKDHEAAKVHLNKVRELSNGTNWNTSNIFPMQKDSLFMQTSYLLHVSLMREAQQLIGTVHYEQAEKLASQAIVRAAEACYHDGETKALLLKGICETNLKHDISAGKSFKRAYHIQAKLGCHEGICEARIQLAKAYLMSGNADLSLSTLKLIREDAEKYNLSYYLAQANWQLGEYYLNHGQAHKATPLLVEALALFQEGNHIKESEQVRVLEAISTGLRLFPKFVELFSFTSNSKMERFHLLKLVDWKDSRKLFCVEDDEFSDKTSLTDDAIKESLSLTDWEVEEGLAEELPVDDPNATLELDVSVNSLLQNNSIGALVDEE